MIDPLEAMELGAENWAADNIQGDKFKCQCGEWALLTEAAPSSASPYALPICGTCFDGLLRRDSIDTKNGKT